MRLNLDNCVFGVQGGKFLSFMLTHRGIEANPNKTISFIVSLPVEDSQEGLTILPTPQEAYLFPLGRRFSSRGEPSSPKPWSNFYKDDIAPEEDPWWVLYMDNFSNSKGGSTDIILEGLEDITLEHSLKFDFKASNNQDKYEAFLVGLDLAREVDALQMRHTPNPNWWPNTSRGRIK
ncbi:hypothetical protein CR513_17510, partial [Mucuna pruriens]